VRGATALAVALFGIALSMLVVALLIASADPSRAAELLVQWPIDRVATLAEVPLATLGKALYLAFAVVAVLLLRRPAWSVTAHLLAAVLAAVAAWGVWMLAGGPGALASEVNGGLTSTLLRLLAGALLATLITSALARSVGAREPLAERVEPR